MKVNNKVILGLSGIGTKNYWYVIYYEFGK